MEYPRNTIWYIEARPYVGPPGFAPSSASMGSAVVVELERYKPDGIPYEPSRTRKYLLTCGHVLRGKATAGEKRTGWGPLVTEICCFWPNSAYLPTREGQRRSGVFEGAFLANVHEYSPHYDFPDEVPEPDRKGFNDWVLLDVQDDAFQVDAPAAKLRLNEEHGTGVHIAGYPGGAAHWKIQTKVQSGEFAFTQQRESNQAGMLMFDGIESKEGMSGGGVFSSTSKGLLGLHRASQDEFLARYAVSIEHILSELRKKWRVHPVLELRGPLRPPERDPCQDLVAGTAPLIPFINRRKLRDNLHQICQSGSTYKAICMSEQGGTGKSWSRHLLEHIARERGMVMGLIKLASTQTIQAACLQITLRLKLDEAAMRQSVLVDQPSPETIGQKFAYWLVYELIDKGGPRRLLLVDEIRTAAGTNAPLHDELVIPLAKELADAPPGTPLVLILAGAPFPGDETTDLYVLREEMEPLNDKDVATYLHDYAASKNRVLSLPEHTQLMMEITGGAIGTFDKAKMQSVMEATKALLERGVI